MGEENDDVDGVDASSLLVISNGRCARAGLEGTTTTTTKASGEEITRPSPAHHLHNLHHPSVRAMERQWIPTTIERAECRTKTHTSYLQLTINRFVRGRRYSMLWRRR